MGNPRGADCRFDKRGPWAPQLKCLRKATQLADWQMTPQSHFMVVAPIIEERVNGLRASAQLDERPPGHGEAG